MLIRVSSLIFIVPGIILLVLYGVELSAITECQELGLFYDTHIKQCTEQKPPFNTFYMRHVVLVNTLLIISSLGAAAMCVGMLNRNK